VSQQPRQRSEDLQWIARPEGERPFFLHNRTGGTVTDNSHWRGPLLYNYHYDQLNRITGLDAYYGLDQTANNWSGLHSTADFRERVGYDGNGNIQRYVRNNFGETGLPMDSLGYKYIGGRNQLEHIADTASDAVGGGYDLHNQPSGNYKYDSIGNLVYDSSEHIRGDQMECIREDHGDRQVGDEHLTADQDDLLLL